MLSHSIIKFKPHVPAIHQVRTPMRAWVNQRNSSFIKDDATLAAFLSHQPKEGTWVWRKRNPGYDFNTNLTEVSQLQYVIRVLRTLDHVEMRFNASNGFPETHEIITSQRYTSGDHYRRFTDIRDYEALTDEEYKRFVDDKLQNYIQTVIAPGT